MSHTWLPTMQIIVVRPHVQMGLITAICYQGFDQLKIKVINCVVHGWEHTGPYLLDANHTHLWPP